MVNIPWLSHPLTEEQVRDHFMLMLEDDTEEQPWMIMGDLQFWSAAGFAYCLRSFARERGLPWYVASMLPIRYSWRGRATKKQLAPDVMVAFVADHARASFDVDVEGGFPPFVLEVISPSSSARDQIDKREAYDALGVQEYALFTPRSAGSAILEGYRRTTGGRFETWTLDDRARLWSEQLGLYLVVDGSLLQIETPEGQIIPTPDRADEARRLAELDREREARARREAEEAQRSAEAEVERLRRELDRLRNRGEE